MNAVKKKRAKKYRRLIDSSNIKNIILIIVMIVIPIISIAVIWMNCMMISQALKNRVNEMSEAIETINQGLGDKSSETIVSSVDDVLQLRLFDSGISIIAIAVSVWIGLNIYNNCRESSLEKQLQELTYENQDLNREYKRVLLLMQLDKTENNYDASKSLYKWFGQEDIDEVTFDSLIQIEKNFAECCKSYEKKRWKRCKDYAEQIEKHAQMDIMWYRKKRFPLVYLYLQIRQSDALFYKNFANNVMNQKMDESEMLLSIEKYKKTITILKKYRCLRKWHEPEDIKEFKDCKDLQEFQNRMGCNQLDKSDRELLGYMYNTIGYTYLLLNKNCHWEQEWLSNAKKYLSLAVANNPKGRYLQNLGSYYENGEMGELDIALRCYKKAIKSVNPDKKIYNLLGSLYLKMVDEKIGIKERFETKEILKNMFSRFSGEGEFIKYAYTYLDMAVKITPEVIDSYYNFSKANLYYWLWSGCKDENRKKDSKLYIEIALKREPDNTGALFTQRNYFEAIGAIEEAYQINEKICGKGDAKKAKETYENYLGIGRGKGQNNMLNEEYLNDVFIRQNIGANEYTRNIKAKAEFERLLMPVYDLYKKKKDKTEETLFSELSAQSGLQERISKFIYEQKQASGLVLSFGTAKHREVLCFGNQQELDDEGNSSIIPMRQDSIFDMASVTKIFTCLSVLKLVDMNVLKLSDDIFELDNRFIHLSGSSVEDLLSFKVPLKTADRIEAAQGLDEADKLIFEIAPDFTQTRLYSDMGAMVLKYVIERITGQEYYEFVKKHILSPCNMQDTTIEILPKDLGRTVSNNYERRIQNNKYIVLDNIKKGIISDGKARRLNQFQLQLHGHAGMFSTVDDMSKLSQALLQGKIVNLKWLEQIGINRTGRKNDDGSFSQFHGYLCYSKNPVEQNSEVNHFLSGNAFALGGYTGNQLTIDAANQVFLFMASNRCHNRVTSVTGDDACVTDGFVEWNDGKKYLYNKEYAYIRDAEVVEPAIELALQYRFLEWLIDDESM